MTRNVFTRPLETEDEPLLAHATLGNLNWSEERFTERDLKSRSEFGHYTQLVPERGDFGFVAECADEVVGVAWALFLPADDPGYGFLDEFTPEMSLWVRDDSRGRGVSVMSLRLIVAVGENRGVARRRRHTLVRESP